MRQVTRRLLGVVLAAALLAVGCGHRHHAGEVVVGATNDPESVVLAELYAAALRSFGSAARVDRLPDPIAALDTGNVGVAAGFTGQVLQRFAPGSTALAAKDVYAAMVAVLPEGVAAGDYATAAQDAPAAVVTQRTATAWGGRDLAVLVRHCAELTTGDVAGTSIPTAVGSCKLPGPRQFLTAPTLFDALRAGTILVAWTTTADPSIPEDVQALSDTTPPMIQAENVVPLYRRHDLSEQQVQAIDEIAGEFDTAALADMRRQVAQGHDPRQVADAWLAAHPLGR